MSAGQSPYGGRGDALLPLPGVEGAVVAARVTVDLLLGHRVVRARAGAVAAEVSLRCARASASIESGRDAEDGPLLAGALRAEADLPALVRIWATSPRQAL